MKLPDLMQAMVLTERGKPLVPKAVALPVPTPVQVLVKVIACGVCRTDLHIVDGELEHPKLPLIPGHEIVGMVVKTGTEVTNLKEGELVGIPWLGYTCGKCRFCLKGQENLCEQAAFTGYTLDGGYAEYTVAHHQYCSSLPVQYANSSGAPLLYAGFIGYRAYNMMD
jgi:propanol-preferring alcohol dehydrogenase